jgi:hypothetical protein
MNLHNRISKQLFGIFQNDEGRRALKLARNLEKSESEDILMNRKSFWIFGIADLTVIFHECVEGKKLSSTHWCW